MIKMVPRGVSATADAYLTPILKKYLDGFFKGFDAQLREGGHDTARVEFMGSDGGLLDLKNFSGLKSILSGPAGGVVGYALTSWDDKRKTPIIGYALLLRLLLTWTVSETFILLTVSTSAGHRRTYRATKGGTRSSTRPLQRESPSPHHSSTSTPSPRAEDRASRSETDYSPPGPRVPALHLGLLATSTFVSFIPSLSSNLYLTSYVTCRKGGPLAVTDANLVLGRLIPDFFPKIFGKSENEPLDAEASKAAFEVIAQQVNGSDAFEKKLSLDEIAYGYVR